MKKKHLIMIAADQLRRDVLGKGFTPNIDALVGESIHFERTYCASPLCVPARGALFTGMCPNTNGSKINPWFPMDAPSGQVHKGIPNLYGMMEEGGWDCIHSGKQHLFTEGGKIENDPDTHTTWTCTETTYLEFLKENGKRAPGGPKFRTPVAEMAQGLHTRMCTYSNPNTGLYDQGAEYYFDTYFTDRALKGLRERDTTKPLFLSAMFLAPHPPLEIPDPWYSRVKPEQVKLPENVGKWYKYQSPLQMYNLTGIIGSHYNMEEWAESWRVYLGLVGMLDDCIGEILDELKKQGIYDDCMILFTSDHGEMMGSHRLYQKMCMYEESAHVNLSIRLPGAEHAGRVINDTVSHLDVLPTLCDYLDMPEPKCEGRSLRPLMEGGSLPEKDVFIQFDGNGARSNFQRCVVRGNYKLIADVFKDEVYYELYDTVKDDQEADNLLFGETFPEIARDMLASLLKHMEETHDELTLPNTNLDEFVRIYRELPAKPTCIL